MCNIYIRIQYLDILTIEVKLKHIKNSHDFSERNNSQNGSQIDPWVFEFRHHAPILKCRPCLANRKRKRYLNNHMLVVVGRIWTEEQNLLFELEHFRIIVHGQLPVVWQCVADIPVGGNTVEEQPNVEVQFFGVAEIFTATGAARVGCGSSDEVSLRSNDD